MGREQARRYAKGIVAADSQGPFYESAVTVAREFLGELERAELLVEALKNIAAETGTPYARIANEDLEAWEQE